MDTPPECLLDYAARKALFQGAAAVPNSQAHAQPEAEPQPCATPECFLPCARDAERTLAAKRSIAASLHMFDRSHARVKALLLTMRPTAPGLHTELAQTSDSEESSHTGGGIRTPELYPERVPLWACTMPLLALPSHAVTQLDAGDQQQDVKDTQPLHPAARELDANASDMPRPLEHTLSLSVKDVTTIVAHTSMLDANASDLPRPPELTHSLSAHSLTSVKDVTTMDAHTSELDANASDMPRPPEHTHSLSTRSLTTVKDVTTLEAHTCEMDANASDLPRPPEQSHSLSLNVKDVTTMEAHICELDANASDLPRPPEQTHSLSLPVKDVTTMEAFTGKSDANASDLPRPPELTMEAQPGELDANASDSPRPPEHTCLKDQAKWDEELLQLYPEEMAMLLAIEAAPIL